MQTPECCAGQSSSACHEHSLQGQAAPTWAQKTTKMRDSGKPATVDKLHYLLNVSYCKSDEYVSYDSFALVPPLSFELLNRNAKILYLCTTASSDVPGFRRVR
ncbi:hypothetical protein TURU_117456 [Turdus rufiventris]|nr:hypothetical protein TURU_117456 [Turdus rufiventris]